MKVKNALQKGSSSVVTLINSALTDKRENFYNLWILLLQDEDFELQAQKQHFFAKQKLNSKHEM